MHKKLSASHSLILFLCIFAFSGTQSLAHELPDLGNPSSAILSRAQEQELGNSIIKELYAASAISSDPIVNAYLQALGYRLVATQSAHQATYQFFNIEDKTLNAFALPGGFIGVNTGLMLATDTESELAGVMAHEIGHVQQRHIARIYEHYGRLQLSTIAGMIAGILVATQNPQAGQGIMAATLGGSQQALIDFTRDHEKEADYVGINIMAKAGFDPMGMPAFFQRMDQDLRLYGNHIPEYLLTHPLTESRIMAARARAHHFPYQQIPDSLQYHLVKARLLAHSFATAHEAISHFEKMLARGNYRHKEGALYGYALALIEAERLDNAQKVLEDLLALHPSQPLYELAYAQMQMHKGEHAQGLQHFADLLQNHPGNYPIMLTYCEWLIKVGAGAKAIPILEKQLLRKPVQPILWTLLSAAFTQHKILVKAHLAQSQYLQLNGDIRGAITQLQLAYKSSPITTHEKRHIESQIRELRTQLRQKVARRQH